MCGTAPVQVNLRNHQVKIGLNVQIKKLNRELQRLVYKLKRVHSWWHGGELEAEPPIDDEATQQHGGVKDKSVGSPKHVPEGELSGATHRRTGTGSAPAEAPAAASSNATKKEKGSDKASGKTG